MDKHVSYIPVTHFWWQFKFNEQRRQRKHIHKHSYCPTYQTKYCHNTKTWCFKKNGSKNYNYWRYQYKKIGSGFGLFPTKHVLNIVISSRILFISVILNGILVDDEKLRHSVSFYCQFWAVYESSKDLLRRRRNSLII